MTVKHGSMMAVASMRGVTSFWTGSVPSARMASICSVTFMEPSSLAMPDELRPATMTEVSTGTEFAHEDDGNDLAGAAGFVRIAEARGPFGGP